MELGKSGRSKATTNRRLASLRAYYGFMIAEGVVKQDPNIQKIQNHARDQKKLVYICVTSGIQISQQIGRAHV